MSHRLVPLLILALSSLGAATEGWTLTEHSMTYDQWGVWKQSGSNWFNNGTTSVYHDFFHSTSYPNWCNEDGNPWGGLLPWDPLLSDLTDLLYYDTFQMIEQKYVPSQYGGTPMFRYRHTYGHEAFTSDSGAQRIRYCDWTTSTDHKVEIGTGTPVGSHGSGGG